jgi:nicotinate-nucleotide adenylyltransferase
MPRRAPRSTPSSFGSVKAAPPAVRPGQRIGLLGGSFNPPHAGHALISRIALTRLGLDQVWWIVTPGNPLKSRAELAPLAERVVASRAVARHPRIRATAFEQHLPATFTAVTLAFLKRRARGVHFVWLMGADNLANFDRWQHWREIAAMMPIAVIDRPGWRLRAVASRAGRALAPYRIPECRARLLPGMHPPAWVFLTGPLSPLSSTELRLQRAAKTGAADTIRRGKD